MGGASELPPGGVLDDHAGPHMRGVCHRRRATARKLQAVAYLVSIPALPRRGAPERREDDQRTPEGPPREHDFQFPERSHQRRGVFRGVRQAGGVEEAARRAGFLPRLRPGAAQLWPTGLEHPVRLQRPGLKDLVAATADVPRRSARGPAPRGAAEDFGVPHRRVQLRRKGDGRSRPPMPHVDPHRRGRRAVPRQHHGRRVRVLTLRELPRARGG